MQDLCVLRFTEFAVIVLLKQRTRYTEVLHSQGLKPLHCIHLAHLLFFKIGIIKYTSRGRTRSVFIVRSDRIIIFNRSRKEGEMVYLLLNKTPGSRILRFRGLYFLSGS